ncbi:nucleoside hydrolase [bacterium]|nr:nucleoside hydrolase [bacterium]
MAHAKLIIDTDPGQDIDDLLALTFALRRPELDIKAITTVTWPADKRARLVNRLLRHHDRTDIPVAAGADFPLHALTDAGMAARCDFPRVMNHYAFAEPEDPRDAPADTDAADLIIRTIEQHPHAIVLACIAPLTNIARALQRRPEIAGKVRQIIMMGGETALDRVEHNVSSDYTAADIVLSSGIPIVMGTWDVTRRFTLSKEDCALFRGHPSPLCRALGRAIDLWQPAQSWKPGPVMYDLFPMVHAFDQSYYNIRPSPVRVVTAAGDNRGRTIIDDAGQMLEVTTDINAAAIRSLYLATVLGEG